MYVALNYRHPHSVHLKISIHSVIRITLKWDLRTNSVIRKFCYLTDLTVISVCPSVLSYVANKLLDYHTHCKTIPGREQLVLFFALTTATTVKLHASAPTWPIHRNRPWHVACPCDFFPLFPSPLKCTTKGGVNSVSGCKREIHATSRSNT